MKWSKKELALLNTLRFEKPYVPFAQCSQKFMDILGIERSQDAIRNMANKVRNAQSVADMSKDVIGVLDIETTNFKANIGYMLSWAIYYPHTDKTVHDVITKKDISNYSRDKRICKSLIKELENVTLLITYNGTKFDIPFMRTRCKMQKVKNFPEYGSMKHIDAYFFCRGKVATHRKSLDVISTALGVGGKTPVDISVWALAMLGHPKSLATVLEHNLIDVKVTWDTFAELQPYGRYASKSI